MKRIVNLDRITSEQLQIKSRSAYAGLIILIAVAYFLAGKLGLRSALINPHTSALWPVSGIALSTVLLLGYKVLPGIFLGAFFVFLTTSGSVYASFAIAVGNTLEILVASFLANKYGGGKFAFTKRNNIFVFASLAGALSPIIGATIGTVTLVSFGFTDLANFWVIWVTWWVGTMGGILVVSPLILLWTTCGRVKWTYEDAIKDILVLILTFFISFGIFGGYFNLSSYNYPLSYVLFPILILAAFKSGRRVTITANVIVSTIAIWGTLQGYGPFGSITYNYSVILLAGYLATITLTSTAVAAEVSTRHRHEKRFQALIENSFDAMLLVERKKIKYASPSSLNVLGHKSDKLIDTDLIEIIHESDRELVLKVLEDIEKNHTDDFEVFEARVEKPNGSWIWTEATAANLIKDPFVRSVVINFHDITDEKEAKEIFLKYYDALVQEKAKIETLLASIGDIIVATDHSGKIILANKAFEEQMGWKVEEVLNEQIHDVIPMDLVETPDEEIYENLRPLEKALSSQKKFSGSYYISRKNGSKFPAIVTASPVIFEGNLIGGIKVIHDVSREKEIDRAKSEFIALASHQLRTPLTIVSWSAEMVLKNFKTLDSRKKKEYLQKIYDANQRMIHLTDALLNVSRIEMGTYILEPVPTNIVKIAKTVLDESSREIETKKIKVETSFAKMPRLNVDPNLTRIIFQNLISNAAKYTPAKGRIKISVELNEEKEQEVLIRVEDTGYGIPLNQQPMILTKLFRADNIKEVDTNGTGLGLYIVKSILERIGGKIWFESMENRGSTFYVTMPLSMPEKKGTKALI